MSHVDFDGDTPIKRVRNVLQQIDSVSNRVEGSRFHNDCWIILWLLPRRGLAQQWCIVSRVWRLRMKIHAIGREKFDLVLPALSFCLSFCLCTLVVGGCWSVNVVLLVGGGWLVVACLFLVVCVWEAGRDAWGGPWEDPESTGTGSRGLRDGFARSLGQPRAPWEDLWKPQAGEGSP